MSLLPKLEILNQWKHIGRGDTSVISLLGFGFSFWSDYRFYRQTRVGICLLGFDLVLAWPRHGKERRLRFEELVEAQKKLNAAMSKTVEAMQSDIEAIQSGRVVDAQA